MKKKISVVIVVMLFLATTVMATTQTVPLCYKNEAGMDNITGTIDDWQCHTTHPLYPGASGTIIYEDVGQTLIINVTVSGLPTNTTYQLGLQGRDGNDGNTELGNNCDTPNAPANGYVYTWECGFMSGGTGSQEGFWNFDLVATTSVGGGITQQYSLVMPSGHYGIGPTYDFGFGFNMKTAVDSPNSNDYVTIFNEADGMDWTINNPNVGLSAGIADPICSIRVTPNSIDFGNNLIPNHDSPLSNVTVSNEGTRDTTITAEVSSAFYQASLYLNNLLYNVLSLPISYNNSSVVSAQLKNVSETQGVVTDALVLVATC